MRCQPLSHEFMALGRADRELKSNHGRVNINGALSWPNREMIHLEVEKIAREAMITLFERPAARHSAATAISVVRWTMRAATIRRR
jgi:hypothetical protein